MADDRETKFWRYAKDNYRTDYEASYVVKPEEATQFNISQTSEIVRLYQKLKKNRTTLDVELVKITIKTDVEVIPMDDPEILEERRRIALEKLSHDDVLALGVEGMATYSKLKFHQTPRRINSDDDY